MCSISIRSFSQAVQQLTAYFSAYSQVPKIRELTQAISRIQADLRRQIQVEFENHLNLKGELVGNGAVLADACSVVNVMDQDFKVQTIQNYCDRLLRGYHESFSGSDVCAALTRLAYDAIGDSL